VRAPPRSDSLTNACSTFDCLDTQGFSDCKAVEKPGSLIAGAWTPDATKRPGHVRNTVPRFGSSTRRLRRHLSVCFFHTALCRGMGTCLRGEDLDKWSALERGEGRHSAEPALGAAARCDGMCLCTAAIARRRSPSPPCRVAGAQGGVLVVVADRQDFLEFLPRAFG